MTTSKTVMNNNKVATSVLRQDINNLKHDVTELAQHAVEAGAENAAMLRDQASERIDEL